MSWINGIMALVTSDELAKDVASAEALLDRHQVITYYKYSVMFRIPLLSQLNRTDAMHLSIHLSFCLLNCVR